MSEIKAKRWRLNGKTSIPHLFAGDSKTALCGAPKKAPGHPERQWEDVPDARYWEICQDCQERRRGRQRRGDAAS